jgi:hypothetical protein
MSNGVLGNVTVLSAVVPGTVVHPRMRQPCLVSAYTLITMSVAARSQRVRRLIRGNIAASAPLITVRETEVGSIWRCKGPHNYSALFSDEGNVVSVEFGPTGRETNLGGLQWRGSDRAVGPRVEWRVEHGTPYAAILRIGILEDDGRAQQRFLIAKVGPEGSCRITLIDAQQPSSNARARQIADTEGRVYVCGQ